MPVRALAARAPDTGIGFVRRIFACRIGFVRRLGLRDGLVRCDHAVCNGRFGEFDFGAHGQRKRWRDGWNHGEIELGPGLANLQQELERPLPCPLARQLVAPQALAFRGVVP